MAASPSHADPIRDLNNYLQRQPGPGGNMAKDFKWSFMKEGPEHDALYHVTAVCKHSLFVLKHCLFFQQLDIRQSGE